MLDVDALNEALELPSIKIGGKTYTGKILSLHQMLPLIKRFEDMGESSDIEAVADLLGDVFETAGYPPEVAEQIPMPLMAAAVEDFFESQVEGNETTANRKTRRALTK